MKDMVHMVLEVIIAENIA